MHRLTQNSRHTTNAATRMITMKMVEVLVAVVMVMVLVGTMTTVKTAACSS